ncbi:MAG: hypothetical protein AAFW69_08475, partial [Pseudomonadota bacterium]
MNLRQPVPQEELPLLMPEPQGPALHTSAEAAVADIVARYDTAVKFLREAFAARARSRPSARR